MEELLRLHDAANGPMYLLETDTVICESLGAAGDSTAELSTGKEPRMLKFCCFLFYHEVAVR